MSTRPPLLACLVATMSCRRNSIPMIAALVGLSLACGPAVTGGEGSAADTDGTATSAAPSTTGMSGPTPLTTSGVATTDTTTTDTTGPLPPLDGTSSDSSSDDGGGITVAKDSGMPSYQCGLVEQDCPRGEKCMPWDEDGGTEWNASRCVTIDPTPNPVGAPCTVVASPMSGMDDCDGTSMCLAVDPNTLEGTCSAFCEGSDNAPTCADPVSSCHIGTNGSIFVCLPQCNPLVQDCGPDSTCVAHENDGGFACLPDNSGNAGAPSDPCLTITHCSPGNLCIDNAEVPGCAEPSCCSAVCELGGASRCLPGQVCIPYYIDGQAPAGLELVGICALE